ncbi:MAG TPA: hypothetical protein VHG08_24325 [Longimicrobium sp.]|nr:hypothetical protein [Longimicrobium sp.]
MRRNRYDEGRMRAPYDRGYGRPMRGRGHYDAEQRGGGYDRGWREAMAYGREPGAPAPMFTPFGWDPMMRWAGWDPLMGFVPYQDTPREWSYGLAEDARRYDHPYYRGGGQAYGGDYGARGYGRDYRVQRRPYGRGYDTDHPMQPRRGPRR